MTSEKPTKTQLIPVRLLLLGVGVALVINTLFFVLAGGLNTEFGGISTNKLILALGVSALGAYLATVALTERIPHPKLTLAEGRRLAWQLLAAIVVALLVLWLFVSVIHLGVE